MLRAAADKPNIVILMLDALRADRLGCYGRGRPVSPSIDRIARQGVLFENAIASAPWTLPSHASLFTGLTPSAHGADDLSLRLKSDVPTLAEFLAGAGYSTAAFSPHNGWLSRGTGLMRGFQVHVGPEDGREGSLPRRAGGDGGTLCAEGQQIIGFARQFLSRAGEGRPLLLFLHSMINHEPYHPAEGAWDRSAIDRPDGKLIRRLQRDFRRLRADPSRITPRHMDALDRLYGACVATVDELCREVFSLVGKYLGWENSLLVITSDHGQNLGEHGMFSHWLCLFETLLRVPLIIYPRTHSGLPARVQQPVQQSDLFYTLLSLSGCRNAAQGARRPVEKDLFLRALGQFPPDTYLFAEHTHPRMTLRHIRRYNPRFEDAELAAAKKAVRTKSLKYVLHSTGSEFLYDLRADRAEERDLSAEREQTAAELRGVLLEELGGFSETGPATVPEERFDDAVLVKLDQLGYL